MTKVFAKRDKTISDQEFSDLIDKQYEFFKSGQNKDGSKTSLIQAMCGPSFRRATWTCFVINVFNQYSGINAIIVYANRLVKQMNEQSGGEFPISTVAGTVIIGVVGAITAYFPIFYIGVVGRKLIFAAGHFGMGASLIACGFFIKAE